LKDHDHNAPSSFYFCFLRLGVSQKALRHLGHVNGFTSALLGHHTLPHLSHLKAFTVVTPIIETIAIHYFISITLIQYLDMYNSYCITVRVSMTEYQKECMYCKQEITMSDETGKWLPYNKDGSSHDCRNNKNKKETQKQEPSKKEFTLEEVRRKLESLGIIASKTSGSKQFTYSRYFLK
jgi:hypothetical protein